MALDGGRVVGCVLFHPEGPESGRLFQMAVEPARQGSGLGTRLAAEVEALAKASDPAGRHKVRVLFDQLR